MFASRHPSVTVIAGCQPDRTPAASLRIYRPAPAAAAVAAAAAAAAKTEGKLKRKFLASIQCRNEWKCKNFKAFELFATPSLVRK